MSQPSSAPKVSLPTPKYIPGVCNIGPAERATRRRMGIIGSIVAVVLLILAVMFNIPWPLRLVLILPAAGGASGLLQDAMHFCAGFGMQGLYNVLNSAGQTDDVDQKEYRQKDRAKALQIIGLSILIGIVFAAIGIIL